MEGGGLVEKASLSRAEDQLVGVRNSFSGVELPLIQTNINLPQFHDDLLKK